MWTIRIPLWNPMNYNYAQLFIKDFQSFIYVIYTVMFQISQIRVYYWRNCQNYIMPRTQVTVNKVMKSYSSDCQQGN